MTTADGIPEAAVEAAQEALWTGPFGEDGWRTADVRAALAAAAPHMRAQVLDEVDAALRDWEAFDAWMEARPDSAKGRWTVNAAQYLRDTLTQPTEGDRNE